MRCGPPVDYISTHEIAPWLGYGADWGATPGSGHTDRPDRAWTCIIGAGWRSEASNGESNL